MADRERQKQMLQMLQHLQAQQSRQNGSGINGSSKLIENLMVSRSSNKDRQKLPQSSSMNGSSSIEFASNTGNGGTWQKNGLSNGTNFNSTNNSNGYSFMTGFSQNIIFKCSECALSKSNFEELEVHIKTEHLHWMPYHCQFCNASRASLAQMREHVYSSHKRDDPKFLFVDNLSASRKLTQMLDNALIMAVASFAAKKISSTPSTNLNNGIPTQPMAKRPRLDPQIDLSEIEMQPRASATVTVLPRSSTSDILAQLTAGSRNDEEVPGQIDEEQNFNGGSVTEGGADDQTEMDDYTATQLSQIFGNANGNVTSEFDDEYNDSYMSTDNDASKSLLDNINALFNNTIPTQDVYSPSGKGSKTKISRAPRQINTVSKKRVLGECSRCQKPVTAGARQMHMFYHLAKDQNTYRFKCLFDDCEVQHYRKDQMENHQSKCHGRIDPDMMEDRSAQLHEIVQKLSLELLGTSGNQPGPTAERAQIVYNNMQREAAEAPGKKKRRSGFVRSEFNGDGNSSPSTSNLSCSPHQNRLGGELDSTFVKPETHRNEDYIKCMLCAKTIMQRTRGFHLLWHLNNDLGIIRYHCKHCDFKHDRSQSINNHGKREHGDDNCCTDTISNYDEEIRSMSKACFGVEQLFTKDSGRRKIKTDEKDGIKLEDLFPIEENDGLELDENEHVSETQSDISEEAKPDIKLSPQKIIKAENMTSSVVPKGEHSTPTSAMKKRSTRRFGTRKPKSKKQKLEMVKLREISMVLGGAQYFRKKINDCPECKKCGKIATSRLSHHAYTHIEVPLFDCPECHLGQQSRDIVVKHMKDLHNTTSKAPIDNRLKYAKEIKETIRECYPEYFIDVPIPTQATIEKLKSSLNLSDDALGHVQEENQSDIDEQDQDDSIEQEQDGIDDSQTTFDEPPILSENEKDEENDEII